jgi:tRNA(Ile)-lysidine synthase
MPVSAPDACHHPVEIDAVDASARAAVDTAARAGRSLALAVSGGCDSMVLMHAVHRALYGRPSVATRVSVLTFDHGTGAHAAHAATFVADHATRLGFQVHVGRASLASATEAEWRAARWSFLRASADGATIVTAHTLDDQVETVVMRVLRGTGARGLAGLMSSGAGVERPLLRVTRQVVREYAASREVPFVDDPTNASPAYFRNRVRRDLLPAIHQVRPRFGDEMLALAESAADLRAEVETIACRFVSEDTEDGVLRVARHELATYDSAALCVLWPAIAARAFVTLDRRGTQRLAQFTTSGAPGARIQLSGGVEVFRHRDSFVLRRMVNGPPPREMSLAGAVQFGGWHFRPVEAVKGLTENRQGDDAWTVDLPRDARLSVRVWRPADRMRARPAEPARRVKRFFADAQVAGPRREGWPVVLADDEIVWIPGVRSGVAAPARSGRPVVRYVCERSRGDHSSR